MSRARGPSLVRWVAFSLALTAALPLLGSLVVRAWVAEPYRVPSGSMAPTLVIGDHVLAWKGAFMEPIARGTIVVFPAPQEPSAKYIKRVVGLPGDEIAFDQDQPVITGLRADHGEPSPGVDVDDQCESRDVSWVDETIEGRSWTIALSERPGMLANSQKVVVPPGMLYVVGDNRDHSQDSRVWGFVDQADVIGTVDRIWWSWDACAGGPRSERTGLVR